MKAMPPLDMVLSQLTLNLLFFQECILEIAPFISRDMQNGQVTIQMTGRIQKLDVTANDCRVLVKI